VLDFLLPVELTCNLHEYFLVGFDRVYLLVCFEIAKITHAVH